MKREQQEFQPLKLQYDISPIYANKETATSIHNLRLESNEDKSKLALTLEKKLQEGVFEDLDWDYENNSGCSFNYNNKAYKFSETNIKHIISCTNDCFVVFLNEEIPLKPALSKGIIVCVKIDSNTPKAKVIYYGKVFNDILQSKFVYETDSLQKIYWIEKYRQPRVINIADDKTNPENRILEFVPDLPSDNIEVEVSKEPVGGQWAGGAVKYLITYCNPYMQESNIAYYSSLYFTSIDGHGVNPDGEKLSSEKFVLKISGITSNYSHIRVYRIFYSSLNQPVGYDLGYYPLPKSEEELIITDEGNLNPSATLIDLNSSRFYGVHPISPNTMEIKDNHLLFGGYKLLDDNIKDIDFLEALEDSKQWDEVDYSNIVDLSSNPSLDDLTFFHKNESYLFGVQFMNKQGLWSNVVSVKEYVPTKNLNSIKFEFKYNKILEDYIAARLVCNYPTPETRNFIAQGAVNHTIYDRQKKGYYQSDYLLTNYKKLYYPEVSYNFTESMYKEAGAKEFSSGVALTRTDNVLSFLSPEFNESLNDEYWRLDKVYAKKEKVLLPGEQKYSVFLDVKNPLQPLPSSYTSSSINATVLNTKSYVPNLSIVLPTYYGNKKDNIPSYKHGEEYEYSAYNIPLWKSQSSLNNASSMSPSMGKITSSNGVDTLESDPTQRQYKLDKKIISRLTTFKADDYPEESDFEVFNFKYIQGNESSVYSLNDKNIFYLSNPQTMYTVGSNKYYIKVFENFTKSYAEKGDIYSDTDMYKYADDSLKVRVTPANDASNVDPAKEGFMTGAMNISYKNGSHALLYKDSLNIDSLDYNLLDAGSPFAAMILSLSNGSDNTTASAINVDVGEIWQNEDRGIGVLAARRNNNKKNVCGSIVAINKQANEDGYTYLAPLTTINGRKDKDSFSPYNKNDFADHWRTRGRFVQYNEHFDGPENGLGFRHINSSFYNSYNTFSNIENTLASTHEDFIKRDKKYFVKFPDVELGEGFTGPYFGLTHNGIKALKYNINRADLQRERFNTLPVYYYSPKEDEEASAEVNPPYNHGNLEDDLHYIKTNIKEYFQSVLLLSAIESTTGNGTTTGSKDIINSFKKTYGGGSTAVGTYWLFDTYINKKTEDMIGESGVNIASVPPSEGTNKIYDSSWGTTNNRGNETRFNNWATIIDKASKEELSSFMLEYLTALDYVEETTKENSESGELNLFSAYAYTENNDNPIELTTGAKEVPLINDGGGYNLKLKLEGPVDNSALLAIKVAPNNTGEEVRIIIKDGPHKYNWHSQGTNVVSSSFRETFIEAVDIWKEKDLCKDSGIPCNENGELLKEGESYEYKLYKGYFNAEGVLVDNSGKAIKYKHPDDVSWINPFGNKDPNKVSPDFYKIVLKQPKKDTFSPYYRIEKSDEGTIYYYCVNTDNKGENLQELSYTIGNDRIGQVKMTTPKSIEGITYMVSSLNVDWTKETDTVLYTTDNYKKVYEIFALIKEKYDINPSNITFARKPFTIRHKEGDIEDGNYSLYANWKDKFALTYTDGLWRNPSYDDNLNGQLQPHPIIASKDKYINDAYIQYNLIGSDSYTEGDAGEAVTKKYYVSPYSPIGLIRVYPDVKDSSNYKEYVYYSSALDVYTNDESSVMKPLSTLLPEDPGSIKNTKLLINSLDDIKYLYRNTVEKGEDRNKLQATAINPKDVIKGLDTSTLGIKVMILLPVNHDYINSAYSPYNKIGVEGGHGRTYVGKEEGTSNLNLTVLEYSSTEEIKAIKAIQVDYSIPVEGNFVHYVGEAPIEVSLSIKRIESNKENGKSTGWVINDAWKYKVAMTKEADDYYNKINNDNYGLNKWDGDRGLEGVGVKSVGIAEYSVDISNFESNPTPKVAVQIPVYNLYKGEKAKSLYNRIDYSNLIWQVCSKPEYIIPFYTGRDDYYITLTATTGDCYFGKYQHLLTVPYNEEITNQLIDINEFSVDTHINLLGRYDNRKDLLDHTQTRLENFNKINPVYNQKDNFLRGVYLDQSKLYNTEFPNQIVYSLNKVAGSEEDNWTSINPISGVYDTNGSLGDITSLTDNNGVLYCFHKEGIELVSFNSRVQIAASDGIPIELANSNKLDTVITFDKEHGLSTIDHLVNTSSGIFFLDNKTKCLCTLANRQILNLSYINNVVSYYEKNKDNFDYLQLLYDEEKRELYTLTPENSLLYSVNFGSFVGTFNYNWQYEKLFKFNNETYLSIYGNLKSRVDKLHGGNSYYPNYELSFITNDVSTQLLESVHFISSDNDTEGYNLMGNDLIKYRYSNLEQSGDKPFTSLKVINDYQEGEADDKTLIRTNRVWNWSIPRQKNSRNRILNFWNMITLSNNSEEDIKENIKFYGFNITYYK